MDALATVAGVLREEGSVISPLVCDPPPGRAPVPLGELAASGPRTRARADEYGVLIELVREGYLLHYSRGRVVVGADPDLALLAGDYLYALGLDRLAGLGDLDSVRLLSDLITLAARIHDGGRESDRAGRESTVLWLAVTTAVAAGASPAYEQAIAALRKGSADADAVLWRAARTSAEAHGFGEQLRNAAGALDFAADFPS